MATSITQKYKRKKENTKKLRNVGFELTLEQFRNLVTRADTCDYTGIVFESTGFNSASIERIDKHKPYHVDNCCMVTVRVNQLKDAIEEGDEGKLKIEDLDIIDKIKDTLNSKSPEELTRKYRDAGAEEVVVVKQTVEDKVMGSTEDLTNMDVIIAQAYIKFSQTSKGTVSFSKYKKLYNKKKCDWSGKVFDESNHYISKSFCKKNLSLPFCDDNILVVCKSLQIIKENSLFTDKEIGKFIETKENK